MNNNLNEMEISTLKEATNIGAGHAAIALSQMLNRKIMIAVTSADIVPSKEFLEKIVGGKDTEVAGVYLKTLGDVQGVVIFMFRKDSSLKLSDLLLSREPGKAVFLDEQSLSALKECCSILTGSFFSVIADMIGLRVFNQAPNYAYDKPDTLMYGICEKIFGNRNERLCLATEFIESNSKIAGTFAFIPEKEAMDNMLNKWKEAK